MPEDRDVFAGLTVEENLRLAERDGEPRYDLVYELFPELRERGEQRAGTLSGGQQQMVAIARVLLNDNRLLLVDEPTKGLAPLLVTEVADVLERVERDRDGPARRAEPRRGPADRARRGRARPGPRRPQRARRRRCSPTRQLRPPLFACGVGRHEHVRPATITGLGLGAMYFLIASGLSLIYGLMGVLNFAHGAFLTVGAYAAWWLAEHWAAIGSIACASSLAASSGCSSAACSPRSSSSC